MSRLTGFFSRFFDPKEIDPESRNRILLIGGITAVVGFALVLIAAGYYFDRIESRSDPVFTVGEREFSYDFLEDRLVAATAEGGFNFSDLQVGIATVVSDLQNEELIRNLARDKGFSATDEEVEAEMKTQLRLSQEIDHNEFARILRDELQTLGLSLDRYEEMIETDVLEQKLRDDAATGIPEEAEQVDLKLILVASQEEADAAKARIEGGEAFEDVATEVSTHASSEEGGALGWTPEGLLPDELEGPAFSLEPGALSDVIQNDAGFFVISVAGKETRAIEEDTKTDLITQRFGESLDAAVETYGITNLLTVEQMQRLAGQIEVPRG